MFGSVILDVLIGLMLVFVLLSVVTSTIQESLAGARHRRARTLLRGINELLRNDALVADFYRHPRIAALYRGSYDDAKRSGKLPSYIPADAFASALLDMAARGRRQDNALQSGSEANALTLQTVRQHIANLGDMQVQRLVLSAVDTAQGDLTRAQMSIEAWFNGAMDRVSAWYKRETQMYLFLIGLVVAVLLDVDTLHVAGELYRDPARRDVAVAMATAVTQESRRAIGTDSAGAVRDSTLAGLAKAAVDSIQQLGFPVGWSDTEQDAIGAHIRKSWFGWLLSAVAVSFGAPFWFDLLNKVMVIRSTVKPREKSREEGSEDRGGKSGSGGAPPPAPPPTQITIIGGTGAVTTGVPGAAHADGPAHEWAAGNPQGGVL